MAQRVDESPQKPAQPAARVEKSPLPRAALTQEIGVLLGYQKRWLEDASQVKIVEKTRRCGLSFAEAADCALLAALQNGMDSWYVGYNKDMAKEFITDCANWARFYNLAAGEIEEGEEVFIEGDERKSIVTFSIKFASNFRVTALSSSPNNLRGKKGRVIVDEAAFHPNLKELLKAALALTMWGGQVHIISTHNGADNAFNQIIDEVRAGKIDYSLHRITLDDALADGLFKRICLVTGQTWSPEAEAEWLAKTKNFYGDAADEELFCIPSMGGGKYLSIALIESCMTDDVPIVVLKCEPDYVLEPLATRIKDIEEWCKTVLLPVMQERVNKTAKHYYGHDFARKVDLTVCVPLGVGDDLVRRLPFVVEMACVPFAQQQQVINFIIENLPKFTGGALDAGGNGSQVGEDTAAKFGATRIAQIMLSEAFYREHMPKLKAGLEDGTIQDIPRNSNLRDDLRAVEVVKGVPKIVERTTNAENKKQKRHGDFAVALMLANYATFEMCAGPVRVCSRGSSGAKTSKKNGKKRGKVRQARKPDALRGYPS